MSNKLKHSIDRDFTIAPNAIFRDQRLSYKAKGLWCQIIALPEDWEFSVKGLSKLAAEKEYAISQGLKELEKYGYIKWEKFRVNNQKFAVTVTTTLPIFSDEKFSHENLSRGKIRDNKEYKNKELTNKELNQENASQEKTVTDLSEWTSGVRYNPSTAEVWDIQDDGSAKKA